MLDYVVFSRSTFFFSYFDVRISSDALVTVMFLHLTVGRGFRIGICQSIGKHRILQWREFTRGQSGNFLKGANSGSLGTEVPQWGPCAKPFYGA